MSERCDQCKHWQLTQKEDWTAESIGFGFCNGVKARWKIEDDSTKKFIVGVSEPERLRDAEKSALISAKAYVQDGSEYWAALFTGPDFGCVLFVPNEPPAPPIPTD